MKTDRCPGGSQYHAGQICFPLESLAVRSSAGYVVAVTDVLRTIWPMRTDVWTLLTPPITTGLRTPAGNLTEAHLSLQWASYVHTPDDDRRASDSRGKHF